MVSRQTARVTAAARLLLFLATAAPVLWSRDTVALLALLGVVVVWLFMQVAARVPRLLWASEPFIEALLAGVICGLAGPRSSAILAVLAMAPFVAGLRRGLFGVTVVTVLQLGIVLLLGAVPDTLSSDELLTGFTWTVAGVGLGLVANAARSALLTDTDELAPYLEAQSLIRELIDIAGGLQSGLDVNSIGGLVTSTVRDRLPVSDLALYVSRGEVLVPLTSTSVDAPDQPFDHGGHVDIETLAVEAWARTETVVHGRGLAFPLGESSVVAGALSADSVLTAQDVEVGIRTLHRELRVSAVQLDTALLFSDFRDAATADARKRLAREMHDGVAQDISSLGYLVDALASRPASPKQAEQFAMLRDRITKIVAEVRQSVLTLRTSIGEAESLGAAISGVARHLSESSRIPIQVTLDEQSTRLRAEVEAELFRIAQEAMNNAIKHAQCSSIEVSCAVHAPEALITVADDGRGLQAPRSDSHGLQIMRERARLIDGELTIADHPAGGTVVAVQVSSSGRIPPFTVGPAVERITT